MAKWKKGESGNPGGKPKGAKDKRTELRALFEAKAPELVAKALEMALAGDNTALKICLDRAISAIRPAEPMIQIEGIKPDATPAEKMDAIWQQVAAGKMSTSQAAEMARVIEVMDMSRRLDELEKRSSGAN